MKRWISISATLNIYTMNNSADHFRRKTFSDTNRVVKAVLQRPCTPFHLGGEWPTRCNGVTSIIVAIGSTIYWPTAMNAFSASGYKLTVTPGSYDAAMSSAKSLCQRLRGCIIELKNWLTSDLWLLADGLHKMMITSRMIEKRMCQKASSTHSSFQSYKQQNHFHWLITIKMSTVWTSQHQPAKWGFISEPLVHIRRSSSGIKERFDDGVRGFNWILLIHYQSSIGCNFSIKCYLAWRLNSEHLFNNSKMYIAPLRSASTAKNPPWGPQVRE